MANTPHNAPAHAWATLSRQLSDLSHSLDHAPLGEQDQIERDIVALQNKLLGMPAPSFSALTEKLMLLWSAQLDGPDQESLERRQILSDLQDLTALASHLIGITA